MNEWSDAEISRRLALAIGWEERDVREINLGGEPICAVWLHGPAEFGFWRRFDYTKAEVIWPICVKLNKWPWQEWRYGGYTGRWCVSMPDGPCTGVVDADTAAKAVALAVIKAKEQT